MLASAGDETPADGPINVNGNTTATLAASAQTQLLTTVTDRVCECVCR